MILLAWYFLAVSILYGGTGVTTNGPFPTREAALAAMSFVNAQAPNARYPVVLYGPWETK